jgi:hypothetical protein
MNLGSYRVEYIFNGSSDNPHSGLINLEDDTITFTAEGEQYRERRPGQQTGYRYIDKFSFVSDGPALSSDIYYGGYWKQPEDGWLPGDEVLDGELTIHYKDREW